MQVTTKIALGVLVAAVAATAYYLTMTDGPAPSPTPTPGGTIARNGEDARSDENPPDTRGDSERSVFPSDPRETESRGPLQASRENEAEERSFTPSIQDPWEVTAERPESDDAEEPGTAREEEGELETAHHLVIPDEGVHEAERAPTEAEEVVVVPTTRPADAERTVAGGPGSDSERESTADRTHVVQSGDSFWKLAEKYLGGGHHYKLIVEANPNLNPNRLYVGAKVKIPALPVATGTGTTTTQPATETGIRVVDMHPRGPVHRTDPVTKPVPDERAYRIRPGDGGWSVLAQRFLGDGKRWPELFELNRGRVPEDHNVLPVGTVIELPSEARTLTN